MSSPLWARFSAVVLLIGAAGSTLVGCHETEQRIVTCQDSLGLSTATGTVNVTIYSHHENNQEEEQKWARAAAMDQCLTLNPSAVRCYDGAGMGFDEYTISSRSECSPTNRYREAFGFRTTGDDSTAFVSVNSTGEQAWVLANMASGPGTLQTSRAMFEDRNNLRCSDTATTTTFLLYNADAVGSSHRYYGTAQRPGVCPSQSVFNYRYRASNSQGTVAGEKFGHESLQVREINWPELRRYVGEYRTKYPDRLPSDIELIVVAYSFAYEDRAAVNSVYKSAFAAAFQCMEQDLYDAAKARGEQLTNAKRPYCFSDTSQPTNRQSCPGNAERDDYGTCRCSDGSKPPKNWQCPVATNNNDGPSTPASTCPVGQTWNGSECVTPGCPPPSAGAPPGSCPFD